MPDMASELKQTNRKNLAMTTCSISQLTAKIIRDNGRVTVQYHGNEYVVVHTPHAGLSDYVVETIDELFQDVEGDKLSQPCNSVAECKDWIRTCYAADLEVSEHDRLAEIAHLNALEDQAKQNGKPRGDVWRWFEACNPNFVVGDVMQGKRKTVGLLNYGVLGAFSEYIKTTKGMSPREFSEAASTQNLQLPPGFYLQRVRHDAVHWHNDKGEVSRDYMSASEATEFAWLYHEGQKICKK